MKKGRAWDVRVARRKPPNSGGWNEIWHFHRCAITLSKQCVSRFCMKHHSARQRGKRSSVLRSMHVFGRVGWPITKGILWAMPTRHTWYQHLLHSFIHCPVKALRCNIEDGYSEHYWTEVNFGLDARRVRFSVLFLSVTYFNSAARDVTKCHFMVMCSEFLFCIGCRQEEANRASYMMHHDSENKNGERNGRRKAHVIASPGVLFSCLLLPRRKINFKHS